MLPTRHRLRRSADFSAVVRGPGRHRIGGPLLVVHVAAFPERAGSHPRVGFVVPISVGSAVVRNRVRRRLREICRGALESTPAGVDVVVRALPASASSSYRHLSDALSSQWGRALERAA
jgi:ribonuclease P protein component